MNIIHTEQKELSDQITIVWYWYDLRDWNPSYVKGEDPNFPSCGTYYNKQLISTVNWPQSTVTLEKVERFLSHASEYRKMPGVHHLPESI